MAMITERKELHSIVQKYILEIKDILGKDFEQAIIYGSYARGEYQEDSDIDIAIFTPREVQDFYLLIKKNIWNYIRIWSEVWCDTITSFSEYQ